MSHLPTLIADLALILISASIITLLFKWLKQPLVLGYIIAGLLAGPYINIFPTVGDIENINIWAEIGVIFLLFALGLEFSFKKLMNVGSTAFITAITEVMGIIAAAMIAGHSMGLGMGINSINDLPDWVAFSCFTAISLGTMSGGWKIVKTMGTKITKVTPLEGVIAETAGAFTLYITEMLKIPVSTTHTITGAIIGVGATKRLSAVRWGVTKSLMTAWILTIPVSGLLAAAIYYIVSIFL